jgi:hypothetical protein
LPEGRHGVSSRLRRIGLLKAGNPGIVVYGSVRRGRRRALGAVPQLQVAPEMERLYGDRLEECYEELAHHYSRSDDVEKAVEYLLKAGEKAARASAYKDAVAHFEKGLQCLRPNLQALLGEAYGNIGQAEKGLE